MATYIIGGILLIALFFSARYTLSKFKKGECVGCNCGGAGGCGENPVRIDPNGCETK